MLRTKMLPLAKLGCDQTRSCVKTLWPAISSYLSGVARATWTLPSFVTITRRSPTSIRKPSPGGRDFQRASPVAASTQGRKRLLKA